MKEISDLVDALITLITNFVIGIIGGLIDGLFPPGQLNGLIETIQKACSQFGEIFQMLGAFPAISQIAGIIGDIASSLFSILTDPAKLLAMLKSGADIGSIVGGLAGKSLGCIAEGLNLSSSSSGGGGLSSVLKSIQGVLGKLNSVGKGLGNLGSMFGGASFGGLGGKLSLLRDPGQIIAGLLPSEIGNFFKKLNELCFLGLVGNLGFSIGSAFDSVTDHAFDECMSEFAAHAAIVGPLFNKHTKPTGSYAGSNGLDFFVNSKFVKGAQGNKGITMMGPGSTRHQKLF